MKKVTITENPKTKNDQTRCTAALEGTNLSALGANPIHALGWLVIQHPQELLPDLNLPEGRIDETWLIGLLVSKNFEIEVKEES